MRLERVEEGGDAGLGGLDQARNRKYVAVRTEKAAAVAHELVRAGADVDAAFRTKTPLQLALSHKRTRCVRRLLELGADPNRPDKSNGGGAALHFAARFFHDSDDVRIVRDLLTFGAELDGRDDRGETPMLISVCGGWLWLAEESSASSAGRTAILAELLFEGADPGAVSKKSKGTPGYFIRMFGPQIRAQLRSRVRHIKERTMKCRAGLAAALSELASRCGEADLAVGVYANVISSFTGDTPARVDAMERYLATVWVEKGATMSE